jgi:hypothetical protein
MTRLHGLARCPFPGCPARFDDNNLDDHAREFLACIHVWSWHDVPVWPGTWSGRWARL